MRKKSYVVTTFLVMTIAIIIFVCTVVPSHASEPKVIYVSEGLALKNDGSVWIWGNDESVPKQIGGMTGIKQIASNSHGFAALAEDRTVWLCINGTHLSRVPVLNDVSMLSSHYVLKIDGTVWLWNKIGSSESYEQVPVQVTGLSNIVYMEDKIALNNDGNVLEWGIKRDTNYDPSFENIPPGEITISSVKKVSEAGMHALALKEDGTVWAWGENGMGQLGDGTYKSSNAPVRVKGLSDITAISAGAFHNLALKKDGTVWAWGSNLCGELGDPSIGSGTPTPVKVPDMDHVVQIYAGSETSFVLKSNGDVWAWGRNTRGELGDGTITDGTIRRPYNNGKVTPVKVLLDAKSNPDTILRNNATLFPQPSPSLQPTPYPTPDSIITSTPAQSQDPSAKPSPGFGFSSLIVLICLLITAGIISKYAGKGR